MVTQIDNMGLTPIASMLAAKDSFNRNSGNEAQRVVAQRVVAADLRRDLNCPLQYRCRKHNIDVVWNSVLVKRASSGWVSMKEWTQSR